MIQIKVVVRKNGAGLLAKRIAKLRKELPGALKVIVNDAMREGAAALFNAIVYQDYSQIVLAVREISPEWIAVKQRRGWYEEPLSATLSYANAIYTTDDGRGYLKITVPDSQHPHSSLTFQELAYYFEYGTSKMDPIPHWRKGQKFVQELISRRAKEYLKNAVRRR